MVAHISASLLSFLLGCIAVSGIGGLERCDRLPSGGLLWLVDMLLGVLMAHVVLSTGCTAGWAVQQGAGGPGGVQPGRHAKCGWHEKKRSILQGMEKDVVAEHEVC